MFLVGYCCCRITLYLSGTEHFRARGNALLQFEEELLGISNAGLQLLCLYTYPVSILVIVVVMQSKVVSFKVMLKIMYGDDDSDTRKTD